MQHPLLVCAADLTHLPEVRKILESAFCVRYVDPTEASLRQHLTDAAAYYASLQVCLTQAILETAPLLRAAATPSTGLDHFDLAAMQQCGVAVISLKDDRNLLDQITATAELAWALILACARHIPAAVEAARQGRWARDEFRGRQLAHKTLGILGCGRLGSIVAQYGQAFRMKVVACDRLPISLPGVESVGFDELLRRADILTIHIHLSPENRGLIGRRELARMKPGAMLINTSRGAILDEAALLESLSSGHLTAAGLDVIDGEWRDDLVSHPLVVYSQSHDNLVITPHIGGVTCESQALAYAAAARKLVEYCRQTPMVGRRSIEKAPHLV